MIRLVLALIAGILAALLAYQWTGWPPPPPSQGTEPAVGPNEVNGQDDRVDPLTRLASPEAREAYASVTERPLFRPQRKPPEAGPATPEAVPESPTAVDLAGFDLSAVVITPAAVSAWVRDAKDQELKRLRLGDLLEGWAVKDILSDRLLLERQGERNELLLRDFSQLPSAPAAPPPRARPPPAVQRMPQRPSQRPPQTPQPPGRDQQVAPRAPPKPRPNVPNP